METLVHLQRRHWRAALGLWPMGPNRAGVPAFVFSTAAPKRATPCAALPHRSAARFPGPTVEPSCAYLKDSMNLFSRRRPSSVGSALAASAIALGALAVANQLMARRAERRHPAKGSFMEVDGVRLHYIDRGEGTPVVLIHGNMVTGDDHYTSGVVEVPAREPQGHHLRPSRVRPQRAPARTYLDGGQTG